MCAAWKLFLTYTDGLQVWPGRGHCPFWAPTPQWSLWALVSLMG